MHWSDGYVGIPYRIRGEDRSGADCYGLTRMVYREERGIGIPPVVVPDTFDAAAVNALFDEHRKDWDVVERPEEFDIVEMKLFGISHIGVVLTAGMFLHTRLGSESRIERLDSSVWRHRISHYLRYPQARR